MVQHFIVIQKTWSINHHLNQVSRSVTKSGTSWGWGEEQREIWGYWVPEQAEDQVVCYLGMEGRGIGRAEEVSSCESSARRAARTPPSLAPRRRAAEVLSRRRNIAAGLRYGCTPRWDHLRRTTPAQRDYNWSAHGLFRRVLTLTLRLEDSRAFLHNSQPPA